MQAIEVETFEVNGGDIVLEDGNITAENISLDADSKLEIAGDATIETEELNLGAGEMTLESATIEAEVIELDTGGSMEISADAEIIVEDLSVGAGEISIGAAELVATTVELEDSGKITIDAADAAVTIETLSLPAGAEVKFDSGVTTVTKIELGGDFNWNGGQFKVEDVVGDLDNSGTGTLSPGKSPGVTTIDGNYSQGPDATLEIEVEGTVLGQFDKVDISGDLTLDGTLKIKFLNNYTPAMGQAFRIIEAGSISGEFATVEVDGLSTGFIMDTSELYTKGSIRITGTPDLSNNVDAVTGTSSGLDSVEGNLEIWLDGKNIDKQFNSTLSNNDAIDKWESLTDTPVELNATGSGGRIKYDEALGAVKFEGKGMKTNQRVKAKTIVIAHEMLNNTNSYFIDLRDSDSHNESAYIFDGYGTNDADVGGWYNKVSVDGAEQSKNTDNEYDTREAIMREKRQVTILEGTSEIDTNINLMQRFSEENPGKGHIFEMMVFDRELTDSEKTKINDYLGEKWKVGAISGTYTSDASFTQDKEFEGKAVELLAVTNEIVEDVEVSSDEMNVGMEDGSIQSDLNIKGRYRGKRFKMRRRAKMRLRKHARLKLTERIQIDKEAEAIFSGEVEAPELLGNMDTDDGASITINVVEGNVTMRKGRGVFQRIRGLVRLRKKGRLKAKRIIGSVNIDGDQETRFSAEEVDGDVININGVVAPGESPGITDIDGDYVQSEYGALEIEIGGTNADAPEFDQLKVGGLMNLSGELTVTLIDPGSSNDTTEITIDTSGMNFSLSSNQSGIVGSGLNPTLRLYAGQSYTFNHVASSHPFKLTIGDLQQTINPGDTATITVPANPSGSPEYVCTIHPSMTNSITVAAGGMFTPSLGDQFKILSFGAISGTFDTINLPEISDGGWDITQLYTTGIISVTTDADGDGTPNDVDLDPDDASVDGTIKDLSDTVNDELSDVESNLLLWLDASNTNGKNNTSINDGDTVNKWYDLSGNGHHANQTSAEKSPVLSGNSIVFDGSNDWFVLDDHDDLAINTGAGKQFSMVIVYEADGTNLNEIIIHRGTGGSSNTDYSVFTNDPPAPYLLTFGTGSSSDDGAWMQIDEPEINKAHILTLTLDQTGTTSGTKQFFLNGVSQVAPENSSYSEKANVVSDIYIGSSTGSNYFYKGKINEIMIFDKQLSDNDRERLNFYLSQKWGLQNHVDSDSDGVPDGIEIEMGYSPLDASESPLPDFTDHANEVAESDLKLDGIENKLSLWLDATNVNLGNNVGLSTGDSINQWMDLSMQSSAATNKTGSLIPKIKLDEYGDGLDIIDLEGGYLDTNLKTHTNQDATMFFVYDRQAVATGWDALFDAWSHSSYNTWYLYDNRDNNASQSAMIGNNWQYFNSGNSNELNILTVRVTALTGEAYLNGVEVLDTHDISFRDSNTFRNDRIVRIGREANNSSSQTSDAHLAEILVFYDDLSDEDMQKVSYYLSKKWGVSDYVDSDSDGNMDQYDLTLGNFWLNQAPSFTSDPVMSVNEGGVYVYDITVSDPEGDDITIELVEGPYEMSLTDNGDGTARLYWNTDITDTAQYDIVVAAGDGVGPAIEQAFKLTVANVQNDPPSSLSLSTSTIHSPMPDYALVANLSTNDVDGPTTIYSLVSGDGDTDNDSFVIYGNSLYSKTELTGTDSKSIRIQVSDEEYAYDDSFVFTLVAVAVEEDDSSSSDGSGESSGVKDVVIQNITDLSDYVDQTGLNSNLDAIESDLKLWLDASNVNGSQNQGTSMQLPSLYGRISVVIAMQPLARHQN